MSWVRFPHPALLLGRGLEFLVGLAVDALELVLAQVALVVLLLGSSLGIASVGFVGHRVVARFLLLVCGARLLRQTEVLGLGRSTLLGGHISHDVVLLASPQRTYPARGAIELRFVRVLGRR